MDKLWPADWAGHSFSKPNNSQGCAPSSTNPRTARRFSILKWCSVHWPKQYSKPFPSPKAQGGNPLVHWGKFQHLTQLRCPAHLQSSYLVLRCALLYLVSISQPYAQGWGSSPTREVQFCILNACLDSWGTGNQDLCLWWIQKTNNIKKWIKRMRRKQERVHFMANRYDS